jgi:geranylgeranyl diphosphate synthase type I
VRWGIPQAINAGDAMYTLAYRALFDQLANSGPEIALDAQRVLQDACLALTRGQYLDLDFETRSQVSLDEYWEMIGGKTAALLAACTELGALAAGVNGDRRTAYREFGRSLGLAFQAQDDLLGIWGDEALTGKSSAGDLVAGKKSLPILFGLSRDGEFADRWRNDGPVRPDSAAGMATLLEAEGGKAFTEEQVHARIGNAMQYLEEASPEGDAGELLMHLANSLLGRRG